MGLHRAPKREPFIDPQGFKCLHFLTSKCPQSSDPSPHCPHSPHHLPAPLLFSSPTEAQSSLGPLLKRYIWHLPSSQGPWNQGPALVECWCLHTHTDVTVAGAGSGKGKAEFLTDESNGFPKLSHRTTFLLPPFPPTPALRDSVWKSTPQIYYTKFAL